MEGLLPMVRHEDYLARILGYNLKRVYRMVELEDFTGSHYLYNRDRIHERKSRLGRTIVMCLFFKRLMRSGYGEMW